MKKFLCVISLVIFSVISFAGCAELKYSIAILSDGSVKQMFQVEVDSQQLESAGYSFDDVSTNILSVFEQIKTSQYQNIRKFKMQNAGEYMETNIVCGYDQNGKVFKIYMMYDSTSTYVAYNKFLSGSTGDDKDDEILEQHFLYIKHITQTTTAYYDLENNSLAQDMLTYFNGTTVSGSTAFTLDDCSYQFYYGTPTSKMYSNSDDVVYQDGVYYHIWNFSASDVNNQIQLYTIEVKPVSWYLLALILTLVFTGILTLIVLVQKKRNKNITKQQLDQPNLEQQN